MSRKIKLTWDFFGEDAAQTATHHSKHLKEYAIKQKIEPSEVGVTTVGEKSEAFIIVEEKDMIPLRDQLQPRRGQWIEDNN